ncbi:MAG: prepilin-type cleavage/methylation domain-containing protein [Proteobacteria bacterium]|nr:MAG: prepilin-type cleavage/methylation domain-containing protein [Pseudomonadota bacterium]
MRKAFTMIELIFVIVILGILAAVAIPRLAATRTDALVTTYLQNFRSSLTDIASYYTAKGEFLAMRDMTKINNYDDANKSLKAGGVVFFMTDIGGGAKEKCIKFDFNSDGNLTITSVPSPNGQACKYLQKDSTFKSLEKSYQLGGKGIAYY